MKIVIRFMECRTSSGAQVDVLVFPLELWSTFGRSGILRQEANRFQNRALAAAVCADEDGQRTKIKVHPLPKSFKVLCLQFRQHVALPRFGLEATVTRVYVRNLGPTS